MTDTKPINEIELKHQEVGTEGYVTKEFWVQLKSHDTSTKNLIVQAEKLIQNLRKMGK